MVVSCDFGMHTQSLYDIHMQVATICSHEQQTPCESPQQLCYAVGKQACPLVTHPIWEKVGVLWFQCVEKAGLSLATCFFSHAGIREPPPFLMTVPAEKPLLQIQSDACPLVTHTIWHNRTCKADVEMKASMILLMNWTSTGWPGPRVN